MTPTQADALGLTISQTWRNSPPPNIWTEELANLHYNQAEAAYRKLRRETEHTPTIARFLAVYHTLTAPDRVWTAPDRDGPVMSFDQYMDELIIKAGHDDPEANEMLDIWSDNELHGLSGTNVWKRA